MANRTDHLQPHHRGRNPGNDRLSRRVLRRLPRCAGAGARASPHRAGRADPSVADVEPAHEQLLGHLLVIAARLGREFGVADSGYRLIINHGNDAGQTVPHLHLHLIGGRPLGALVGGA